MSILRRMDKINCGVFLYSYNGILHGIKMNEVELQASIGKFLECKKQVVEEPV